MAAVGVDEERIQQVSQFLRERIRTDYASDKDIDARDMNRVQTDAQFAYRFAKQRLYLSGDERDCLKMLVAALHFRNSYSVNDFTFQDINKDLLQSGICYPRGQDKDGSDVIYINIRLHHKDRGDQLRRFLLFLVERHDRYFLNRDISVFLDCSDAGYSNSDMDLVKFIINLFTQYYPMKLGAIYVHEVPWVMNAVWAIVKTMLSAAAKSKMRVVNKGSVQQHFNREQLSIRHGGSDSWQFSYPPKGELESEGLERILPLLQNEKENEQQIRDLVMEMVQRYEGATKVPEVKEELPESADETADREIQQSNNSEVTKIIPEVKEEDASNSIPKPE